MTGATENHRHNGGPLNDDDARKLWNHIRALENLEEQKADLNLDIKTRKELAKGDGFDTNILGVILKRRKQGFGATAAADNLIRLYEEALEEQKLLPLGDVTVTVKLGSAANGESETPAELSADDGA
jgi:uncharacterized protein (UPF0335 family)